MRRICRIRLWNKFVLTVGLARPRLRLARSLPSQDYGALHQQQPEEARALSVPTESRSVEYCGQGANGTSQHRTQLATRNPQSCDIVRGRVPSNSPTHAACEIGASSCQSIL
eukprot:5567593-Pyramimonas_sp.AAC.1